jgi:3-deoxy-D-manno-octulosonic-acid transferase
MLPLYSLAYSIALIFILPGELRKRAVGLRARWLREKRGFIDLGGRPAGAGGLSAKNGRGPLLWVHAVSVGEAIAASYFIRAFKEKHPEFEVLVSTITDTGQDVARKRLEGLADVFYMPFDLKWALNRAIRRIKPTVFVNMETELWPNLIRCLKMAGVPIIVMNGRISDKSYARYAKIRPLIRKTLRDIDLFLMQDGEYARRVVDLGAEDKNVVITGSFKFDVKVKDEALPWTGSINKPIIIAGSTHGGEEELISDAYLALKGAHKGLNLIIAPRHPQRFGEVEALIKSRGVACVKRSGLGAASAEKISGSVVLLDSIGELSAVYRVCDIAVMGGSFIEHGGQNPLEPAYWGVPAVCGPHMENFPFMEDFYREGAAVGTDRAGLAGDLDGLLNSPERRRSIGERARALLLKNRGAVGKAVEAMEGYLKPQI